MKVRIRARFTNENFRAARIAAGFVGVRDLHNGTGISLNTLYGFENFRAYPRTPAMIRRIERALGLPIDDLFPAVYKDAVNRKLGRPLERVLSLRELPEWAAPQRLPMPEEIREATEMREAVNRALDSLTEREADVLTLRYGLNDGNEFSLKEIGEKYKLTRNRIMQIEAKALRKMQWSHLYANSNSENLRHHMPKAPKLEEKIRMRKVWSGYAVYVFDQSTPVCINLACKQMLGPFNKAAIETLEQYSWWLTTPDEVLKWPKDFLYCEHCLRIYRRQKLKWKRQEETGKA